MNQLVAWHTPDCLEAGCDEAGRGCLAGPVFAAAVIWPSDLDHPLIKDSKKLKEAQRKEMRSYIEAHAIAWAVVAVSPEEIDRVNILWASILGMHRALDALNPRPENVLVDGNRFKPYQGIPFHCIVKGDGKFRSIAAASILAKTHRDEHMEMLGQKFPEYGWNTNRGYPTVAHRNAIREHGPTIHHRRSFKLLSSDIQTELFNKNP